MKGALREARQLYEQSLLHWRALGDKQGIAETLQKLGEIAMDFQHGDEAEAYLRESAELWQSIGEWVSYADCMRKLGRMARSQGRYGDAEAWREQRWRFYGMEMARQEWEESRQRREGEG